MPETKVDQEEINKALFTALEKMHEDVIRATTSNQILYDHVGILRTRVNTLERENAELRNLVEDTRTKIKPRQAPRLSVHVGKTSSTDDDNALSTVSVLFDFFAHATLTDFTCLGSLDGHYSGLSQQTADWYLRRFSEKWLAFQ